jgi:hypothetical protein
MRIASKALILFRPPAWRRTGWMIHTYIQPGNAYALTDRRPGSDGRECDGEGGRGPTHCVKRRPPKITKIPCFELSLVSNMRLNFNRSFNKWELFDAG